jgi:hypothetical protein
MGTPAKRSHGGSDLVSADAEWEAALERGDKEAWGVDSAATPLTFYSLSWNADSVAVIDVGGGERKRLRHTSAELLHDNDGKLVAALDTFEDGDDLVLIGRYGFSFYHAWKLDLPVPSDVGDVSEVQHHPKVTDDETNRAWPVALGENPNPPYYVAGGDLLDGFATEPGQEYIPSDPVGGEGAVSDTPAGSKPFFVNLAKTVAALNLPLELYLRVERASEPLPDELLANQGFFACPECAAMLHLGISPAPPVPDVESSSVPGVPSTNVESRHQP